MGSGGVAIAALPTVTCLKVPFSDGLGGATSQQLNNKPTKSRYCLPDSHHYLLYQSRDFVPGYSRYARYWLPAKATYNQ